MTEQKPKGFGFFMNSAKTKQEKSFGLIVKNGKSKQQKDEKKLYTIVSCCVSAIFLITILVPVLSGGEEKSSGNSYKSVAFDLADLAVDDEAEKVLLEMGKYSDIPQTKIAGGLFDKKDKEERQEIDKTEGTPAAPDEEYKQARKVRERRQARGVSRPATYTQRPRTQTNPGSLTRGGMVSVGGGSSGVSTSIWTSQDKSRQQGSKTNGSTGGIGGTQQLVAKNDIKGRVATLNRAIEESQRGAGAQNADIAAQAASDAFTNNNLEAEDEGLADGMDEFADKFNAEDFKKAVSDKDLQDLKNEAEKEKDKKEDEADPCKSRNRAIRMECRREQFLEKIMEKLIDAAVDIATSYATDGKKGKKGKNGDKDSGKDNTDSDSGDNKKTNEEKVDKTDVWAGKGDGPGQTA